MPLVMFDKNPGMNCHWIKSNYSDSLFIEQQHFWSQKPASHHSCLKTLRSEDMKGSSNVKSYESWRQACFKAYMHTCWDNRCYDWLTFHSIHLLSA